MVISSQKFLDENNIDVYDRIRIDTRGRKFEGIVMPRHSFSKEDIIVLKLDNGYNIGVTVENAKVEMLTRGDKPEKSETARKKDKKLPEITILGTGGTIASHVDYATGAVHPAKTAEEIIESSEGIRNIANVNAEAILSVASEDMGPADWTLIAEKIAETHAKRKEGVIVAHGTDTMAYTASALAFQLESISHPVILTGSQRSSDRPSTDAHDNLEGSAKVALSDIGEVCVVMHSETSDNGSAIWRGCRVRKEHTSARTAFNAPNEGVVGFVSEEIEWKQQYRVVEKETKIRSGFEEAVALVWVHPTMNLEDWKAITKGKKGVVVAGTGLGHVSKNLIEGVIKTAEQIPVAMTSQCLAGRINMNVYSNGRELVKGNVIDTGDMLPETALVKMMWLLKHEKDSVREMMAKDMIGEMGGRRFLE